MTALELYREDRKNRRSPDRRGRQEYFSLLRDTLHEELMRDGRSTFLEAMLTECAEGHALPVLEFAALRECFSMIVDARRMQDASEYVPHICRENNQPLSWRELESGPSFRVGDPQTAEMLRRLKTVSSQLVSMRDQTLEPAKDSAAQRDLEGLMTVNHMLESDNASLRKEREDLRARIAELEEGLIDQKLQNRIDVRRRQAEAQLEAEIAQRRAQAENDLRQLLADSARKEQAGRVASQHLETEQEQARRTEYTLLQADLQAQLQTMQHALDAQLTIWQKKLHSTDYRFLARSFASLCGETNRLLPEVLAASQQGGGNEDLSHTLTSLQAMLNVQLRQMEQALLGLGLQLYWPAAGDPFDTRLHAPVRAFTESEAPENAEVVQAEAPGVQLLGDNAMQEPLVRAVVSTRQKAADSNES